MTRPTSWRQAFTDSVDHSSTTDSLTGDGEHTSIGSVGGSQGCGSTPHGEVAMMLVMAMLVLSIQEAAAKITLHRLTSSVGMAQTTQNDPKLSDSFLMARENMAFLLALFCNLHGQIQLTGSEEAGKRSCVDLSCRAEQGAR